LDDDGPAPIANILVGPAQPDEERPRDDPESTEVHQSTQIAGGLLARHCCRVYGLHNVQFLGADEHSLRRRPFKVTDGCADDLLPHHLLWVGLLGILGKLNDIAQRYQGRRFRLVRKEYSSKIL